MKNKRKLIIIFISVFLIIFSLIINEYLKKMPANQPYLIPDDFSRVHVQLKEITTEILKETNKTQTLRKVIYTKKLNEKGEYEIIGKKIVTFHDIDKNIEDLSAEGLLILENNNIELRMNDGSYTGCFNTAGKIFNPYLKDYIYYSNKMSCNYFSDKEECKTAKFQYQTSFSNVIYKTQKEADGCVFGCKAPCSESLFDPPYMFINCRTQTSSQSIEWCLSLMKKVEFSY